MSDGMVEIITGRERRRRWTPAEKRRIVAEAEQPGARVTEVAARHAVYPSLLFTWRRQVRRCLLGTDGSTGFVPVRLLSSAPKTIALPARPAAPDAGHASGIAITLPDGSRIDIGHAEHLPLLRPIIAALRG